MTTVRTLLVATAVAICAPAAASPPPHEEVVPRVHYDAKLRPPPRARIGDWVKLATPTPTKFGTEFIVVGKESGAFRTIRIDVESGSVELRKVVVEFTGGKHATFQVDAYLTSRHPSARIELEAARYIETIAVTTSRTPRGSYIVMGSASLAPVTQQVALR